MTEDDPRGPISLTPIGWVRSPWPEKFGIPRQSGLTRGVESRIELDRARITSEALRGLEGVSHLWVIGWFHAAASSDWRPTVRPPRLGGATRLGVFATRAPHRPNPIALSLARLVAIDDRALIVSDLDLLDGTPVLDLKPHLPWAEQPSDARCDWAGAAPDPLAVRLAPAAEAQLLELELELGISSRPIDRRATIVETLRWDPRPAHQREALGRNYGVAIADLDVEFVVDEAGVLVLAVRAR